jgi:hypothetical protein
MQRGRGAVPVLENPNAIACRRLSSHDTGGWEMRWYNLRVAFCSVDASVRLRSRESSLERDGFETLGCVTCDHKVSRTSQIQLHPHPISWREIPSPRSVTTKQTQKLGVQLCLW